MKHLTLLFATIFIVQISMAQSIQGKVYCRITGETLPFANVIIFKDSVQIMGVTTLYEGEYSFDNVASGEYNIEAVYIGYFSHRIDEVKVSEDTVHVDIGMVVKTKGVDLSNVNIENGDCLYIPLTRRDETLMQTDSTKN